jgi:hypothetical protein
MYYGEWRKPTEQAEVDAMITSVKSEAVSANAIQSSLDEIKANQLNINVVQDIKNIQETISTAIKPKAIAPIVNKFGVAKPKAITPNSTNAGKNL